MATKTILQHRLRQTGTLILTVLAAFFSVTRLSSQPPSRTKPPPLQKAANAPAKAVLPQDYTYKVLAQTAQVTGGVAIDHLMTHQAPGEWLAQLAINDHGEVLFKHITDPTNKDRIDAIFTSSSKIFGRSKVDSTGINITAASHSVINNNGLVAYTAGYQLAGCTLSTTECHREAIFINDQPVVVSGETTYSDGRPVTFSRFDSAAIALTDKDEVVFFDSRLAAFSAASRTSVRGISRNQSDGLLLARTTPLSFSVNGKGDIAFYSTFIEPSNRSTIRAGIFTQDKLLMELPFIPGQDMPIGPLLNNKGEAVVYGRRKVGTDTWQDGIFTADRLLVDASKIIHLYRYYFQFNDQGEVLYRSQTSSGYQTLSGPTVASQGAWPQILSLIRARVNNTWSAAVHSNNFVLNNRGQVAFVVRLAKDGPSLRTEDSIDFLVLATPRNMKEPEPPLPTIVDPVTIPKTTSETAKVLTSPCLLYTSPSPRDGLLSRMPSSA